MSGTLKIGELAERIGTTAPTICCCEEVGLAPEARRFEAQQRHYERSASRLTFIRRSRNFVPVEQVRTLASLVGDPSRSYGDA